MSINEIIGVFGLFLLPEPFSQWGLFALNSLESASTTRPRYINVDNNFSAYELE